MGEEAGCQVRLHSFDNFIQSLDLNSSHRSVFVGFWPWFRLFYKNQRHLVLVPKVILITFLTTVLGSNPTGPTLTLSIKFISLNSKASSTQGLVSGGNHCCHWHLALKYRLAQF